jgi:two-component system phosphate regulon sensor histidine kinase PhoR
VRGKRLFWRLYPGFLIITLGALLALSWYAWDALRDYESQRTRQGLRARARLAAQQVKPLLAAERHRLINAQCREWRQRADARFTVILPDGTVVGDSHEDPARMDNHAGRPEIKEALAARAGQSVRPSPTLRREMMYVAVPVMEGNRVVGVMRTSLPVASLRETLGAIRARLLAAVGVVAVLAALLTLWLSRHLTRPLQELRRGAERYSEGALQHRIAVSGAREFADVANAMNSMARRLQERVRTVVRQRSELEAVLSSMVEGVLALDEQQRVVTMNRAAAELLGFRQEDARGRSIQEIVRNPDLQDFVDRALATDEPLEGDVTVAEDGDERHLQLRATALKEPDGGAAGTLLVMNDVTRLRRLEDIRREFVANVSHELRTPITAIKGFAETLLSGTAETEEKRRHYLEIIDRQADRLQSLFDDLLTLSRTERQVERDQVTLSEGVVGDVVSTAVDLCSAAAEEKDIEIDVDCGADLRARLNAPLLEQAVFNLLDNAVSYGPEGSRVQVRIRRRGEEIAISVEDEGPGIRAEHLPRLFERFYRVHRGRDRKSGGTGLGLAIVKHIAQAHNGRVSVESTPGEGSTFTIHIPAV